MTTDNPSLFERMQERYRLRDLPWDDILPPPEILALSDELPAGRLLDLGCGTARASIYLAQHGWEADAVDFVPEAIEIAAERVQAAGVHERVRLHVASVTDLSFLNGAYDLAVDVGCFHALAWGDQQRYAAEVARLLRPQATFMLFAHLRDYESDEIPVSTTDAGIRTLFGETFSFAHVEYGETVVREQRWASGWFRLVRME